MNMMLIQIIELFFYGMTAMTIIAVALIIAIVKVNIKLIKKYKVKLIEKFNVVFPETVRI